MTTVMTDEQFLIQHYQHLESQADQLMAIRDALLGGQEHKADGSSGRPEVADMPITTLYAYALQNENSGYRSRAAYEAVVRLLELLFRDAS